MKILIVEDERSLAEDIKSYFSGQDVLCEMAGTVRDALEKIHLYAYDCILLDISLPDGNGLHVLKALKKREKTDGVIIISAKNSLDDKIEGLRTGADDYLTKPFHLAELAVRMTAITRRNQFAGQNQLKLAGLTIDWLAKTVHYHQQALPLTPTEFRLLRLLVSSKNRVLSKTTIAEYLSGEQADLFDHTELVYAHVKNLKKKLADAGCPDYIKTVYAVGYKFVTE